MKQRWFMTAALAAVLFCGCSSSHSTGSAYYETDQTASGGTGNYYSSYNAKEEAADAGYAPAEANSYDEEKRPAPEVDPVLSQEKLVYTGSLTIQSLEYESSLQNIRNKVKELGGIIEYESESDSNHYWYNNDSSGRRYMNMTVRIPTENFETFMTSADGIGKVISHSTNVMNISRQYSDTTVQIEALEKQQERLLAMMDQAQTIEDMIVVETRLTNVQTELNQLKTYRQSMDTDVRYSTVTVSLEEVKEYVHVNESFLERAWNSVVDGWKNFSWAVEDFVIWALYVMPYIVILVVLFFLNKKFGFLRMPKFRLPGFLRRNKKDTDQSEES